MIRMNNKFLTQDVLEISAVNWTSAMAQTIKSVHVTMAPEMLHNKQQPSDCIPS
jgi:hypothetical protein